MKRGAPKLPAAAPPSKKADQKRKRENSSGVFSAAELKQKSSFVVDPIQGLTSSFFEMLLSGSLDVSTVFKSVGRGGVSRMLVMGKQDRALSSIGKFFERGSTLGEATAFTNRAVAKTKNVKPSSSINVGRPESIKKTVYCSNEHPVHEMQFYNIGGTRVYYYYGLDTVRSADSVLEAGLHVRDTAVGVLVLDKYFINQRPGDPSNPLTFWPYQTFYASPQGLTFAECKKVGSSGSNALVDHPLQTTVICQALQSLAEVAARQGYKRLIITGDCGYYALATAAYSKRLTCWGRQSWIPHPDGAFAGFRVPRFKCPSLEIDIVLSLGTTQLISDVDNTKNLIANIAEGVGVIYLTADIRGFYHGKAKEEVSKEYEPFQNFPWATADYRFTDLSMLDVVVHVNDYLLDSIAIQADATYFMHISSRLIEFDPGSTSCLIGLFLGHKASQQSGKGTIEERIWNSATYLKPFVEDMSLAENGLPCPRDEVVEKCAPIFDYFRQIFLETLNSARKEDGLEALEKITEAQEFLMYAALIGNPKLQGEPAPNNWQEMKLWTALRMQGALLSLLSIGKMMDQNNCLPIGAAYADFFANFNADLNKNVLSKVDRSHGIDGKSLLLFDCRYIPGFGIQVAKILTVWTAAKNYLWISTVLRRFARIMQERGLGPVLCHLECTELFSFSPFLQEMGMPVVDAVNSISIASRCTDAPMRFVKFKKDTSTLTPPTPSALVIDTIDTTKYYRDLSVPLRSPTEGKLYFNIGEECVKNLLKEEKKEWQKINFAQPLFNDSMLKWGANNNIQVPHGDDLYSASCALDRECYVSSEKYRSQKDSDQRDSYVQYALREKDEDWSYSAFFGGEIFSDGI